jgi:serine/threonine protein kinase
MASPGSIAELLDLIHKSGVADEKRLTAYLQRLQSTGKMPAASEPSKLAGWLVEGGLLTNFQAEFLMQGKWRRFTIGKYKVLERLGSGGMGTVYLCEHKLMRCMRAIKILPAAKAQDEAALSRFYREARAVAAIDHPNIVHAYDIDQDDTLHFLVMEYVDGSSLQDIVKKTGPMPVLRACHYIRQSAIGLDHAQRAGLVHRDIKPGNILVARDGTVKILDMGLARFFNDDEDILTRKFDENVLGTADYLAPEQALDSHTVDIRADIYSLGATFYFLLTGKTPFGEGTVAQKLFWHQSRQPKPVRETRSEVPPELDAIIAKMMAKDPADRYQAPAELADALAAFTEAPIAAPPESEMPRLSPAAAARTHQDAEASEITAISKPETPRALKKMSGTDSRPSQPTSPAPVSSAAASTTTGGVTTAGTAPNSPAPFRASAGANAPAVSPRHSSQLKPGSPAVAPSPATPSAALATEPSARPAAEPAVEDDFSWQALAPDTADLAAAADTTPVREATSSRARARGEVAAKARERGVNLLVVGLMVGAALLVVAIGGAIWIGYVLFANVLHSDVEGPAAETKKLIVNVKEAGSRPGVYKSLQQAISVARQDSIIEIEDELIEENIVLRYTGARPTGFTIQAAPGKEVVWRPARNRKDPDEALLHLTSTEFFKLKGPGLILDGTLADKGPLRDLVYVIGSCHGLAIEDVQFRNFNRSGVCIMNAAGNLENPIQISGLTALPPAAGKEASLVYIDSQPGMRIQQVDYVRISGLSGGGVPADRLVFVGNAALGDRDVQIQGLKKE